jgi:hypothetical protein
MWVRGGCRATIARTHSASGFRSSRPVPVAVLQGTFSTHTRLGYVALALFLILLVAAKRARCMPRDTFLSSMPGVRGATRIAELARHGGYSQFDEVTGS